jgi:hypothetical protein
MGWEKTPAHDERKTKRSQPAKRVEIDAQRPDRRYGDNLGGSYYRALAAVNQVKREKRDRKPLKVVGAPAQNGFVSKSGASITGKCQGIDGGVPSPARANYGSRL